MSDIVPMQHSSGAGDTDVIFKELGIGAFYIIKPSVMFYVYRFSFSLHNNFSVSFGVPDEIPPKS